MFRKQFAHALGGADGLLQLRVQFSELANRAADKHRVQQKLGQAAERQLSMLDKPGAIPHHQHDRAKKSTDPLGPLSAVREQLRNYERLKLYTYWVPPEFYQTDPGLPARKAEGEANRDFQSTVFGDIKLPLYAVLMPQPNGKVQVVGVYEEGKINSPEKFVAFLKDAQEKAKSKK